jgi:hypothetical protein
VRLKTWRSLCSVLPNTPYVQVYSGKNERVRPGQKADAFASSLRAHPSHSVRFRGARLRGGAITGMETIRLSLSNAGS